MALLVDLDGTLVETSEANFLAYSAALAEVGVEVSRDAFDRATLGRHWRQFLPALLEGTVAHPAAVAARKAEIYPALLDHTCLNEALVALVAGRPPGWRAALVTTASAVAVEALLRHHALTGLFDTIVTGDDVDRHKPFPDAYRLAARRLDADPDRCIAFEDSEAGVAAAKRFGCACLRIALADMCLADVEQTGAVPCRRRAGLGGGR